LIVIFIERVVLWDEDEEKEYKEEEEEGEEELTD
jgi:hypothetical protein